MTISLWTQHYHCMYTFLYRSVFKTSSCTLLSCDWLICTICGKVLIVNVRKSQKHDPWSLKTTVCEYIRSRHEFRRWKIMYIYIFLKACHGIKLISHLFMSPQSEPWVERTVIINLAKVILLMLLHFWGDKYGNRKTRTGNQTGHWSEYFPK